jgi:hypothetical protein
MGRANLLFKDSKFNTPADEHFYSKHPKEI